MIYDCFTFFNELDLLKIRCETLKHLNIAHVLVEANMTHTGLRKPLYYEENADKFSQYNIIHVKVVLPGSSDPWVNEGYQRDAILFGLTDCHDDDIVFISDLDEIPNPYIFSSAKDLFKTKFFDQDIKYCNVKMDKYSYYLNCLECSQCWDRALLTTWDSLKKTTPNKLRNAPADNRVSILDGGWHFSFLGGVDRIIEKLEAYAHHETNTQEINNRQVLENKLALGQSLWSNRPDDLWKFVKIDNSFPEYIVENEIALRDKGLIK